MGCRRAGTPRMSHTPTMHGTQYAPLLGSKSDVESASDVLCVVRKKDVTGFCSRAVEMFWPFIVGSFIGLVITVVGVFFVHCVQAYTLASLLSTKDKVCDGFGECRGNRCFAWRDGEYYETRPHVDCSLSGVFCQRFNATAETMGFVHSRFAKGCRF